MYKRQVVGCAAGKVNDKIVLDLSEVEDKEGQADVPIAMMPVSYTHLAAYSYWNSSYSSCRQFIWS